MRTVLTWVDRRQALMAQQALSGPGGDRGIARDLLDGIVSTDERELSGIWSTASGALGGFRSTEALAATCDPDFDPTAFVHSADTVYIAAPSHHQALVAPLVVGFLDDIRRATYARATESGGRTHPPVVLALDELANVAPLPELPSMVSEGGGQGLLTLACFQDLSQARHRWPGQADGFPSLFGSTVVLPGIGDVATLEALSVLAGEEELVSRTVSRGHVATGRPFADLVALGRPQMSEQLSTQWHRRLAPDVITRGHPGHALAFDARNQPTWIGLAPAHSAEPWVSLRGADRSIAAPRSVHRPWPRRPRFGPGALTGSSSLQLDSVGALVSERHIASGTPTAPPGGISRSRSPVDGTPVEDAVDDIRVGVEQGDRRRRLPGARAATIAAGTGALQSRPMAVATSSATPAGQPAGSRIGDRRTRSRSDTRVRVASSFSSPRARASASTMDTGADSRERPTVRTRSPVSTPNTSIRRRHVDRRASTVIPRSLSGRSAKNATRRCADDVRPPDRWASSSIDDARCENTRHNIGSTPSTSQRPVGARRHATPAAPVRWWRSDAS